MSRATSAWATRGRVLQELHDPHHASADAPQSADGDGPRADLGDYRLRGWRVSDIDPVAGAAMKSRPILFSAPMVRAILNGSKSVTRRTVKCMHLDFVAGCEADRNDPRNYGYECDDGWVKLQASTDPRDDEIQLPCPHGRAGDHLWVRETVAVGHSYDGNERICYRSDGDVELSPDRKWTPSIFMSRRHSRITLEITNVRVERLQEISDADAKAEGLSAITKDGSLFKFGIPDRDGLPGTDNDGWPWDQWERDPRKAYRALWESLNGPGSWDLNPYVWVIEFKKINLGDK